MSSKFELLKLNEKIKCSTIDNCEQMRLIDLN